MQRKALARLKTVLTLSLVSHVTRSLTNPVVLVNLVLVGGAHKILGAMKLVTTQLPRAEIKSQGMMMEAVATGVDFHVFVLIVMVMV